jgi:O-antigen/teichoic acid export membrane protein
LTRHNRPSLRHDTAWAIAGALAQTANQAATMVALAQVAPARVVGQYALGLALAAPLNVFADRAVRTLQSTAAEDDFPLSDYLALRTLVGLGALAVSVLVVALWHNGAGTLPIVLLVAAGRLAEGTAQTFYGRLQRRYQMRRIGQSQVVRSVLATAASLTCLYFWRRLDIALMAGIVANAAVLWQLDRPQLRSLECAPAAGAAEISLRRRLTVWSSMLRLALPLALSTFLVSLSGNLPRLFLSRFEDESTLGVFAILCYLCLPGTIVVSAMLQAAMPRLVESYRDDPAGRYLRLVRRLTAVCTGVATVNGLLMHAFGPAVLRLTLSGEYTAAAVHLDLIATAFGVGFIATVPATALTAQRWFRTSLLTCSLSCSAALIGSAVLIPRLGMAGAAWAMLVSSGVHWLVSWATLRVARPRRVTQRGVAVLQRSQTHRVRWRGSNAARPTSR